MSAGRSIVRRRMRELEPPLERDTTSGSCAAEWSAEGDAKPAMNAVEPVEWDTDSVIDRSEGDEDSSRTSVPVSRTPGSATGTPPASRDGLPDYVALITAEIEAIEARRAAAARISEVVSAGTPRPSIADPSQKRYATASSLGVGELLLTARELTGLTQSQLAVRASTSQSAISSTETGNRLPSVRTLMRIAEAAGFELVVGLRAPGANDQTLLGALITDPEDDLADYVPIRTPSVLARRPANRST
jgi:transcriptional regulator with XRE-family HTH domain